MSDRNDTKRAPMQHLWENTGAPFPLSDGRQVGRGDVFRAALTDPDVIRRRYKLIPAMPGARPTVGDPEPPIRFASDAARDLFEGSGLTEADMEGREGSGSDGGFVKADVEAVIAERED